MDDGSVQFPFLGFFVVHQLIEGFVGNVKGVGMVNWVILKGTVVFLTNVPSNLKINNSRSSPLNSKVKT